MDWDDSPSVETNSSEAAGKRLEKIVILRKILYLFGNLISRGDRHPNSLWPIRPHDVQ
jgi:hypothetical protein